LRGDVRSGRVAIVGDQVLNPAPGEPDRLGRLAGEGWGIVALPPACLSPTAWEGWARPLVDQVVTFLNDGYEVAVCAPVDEQMERFRQAVLAAGWRIERELDVGAAGR
jgi:hypothetical protein